MCFEDSRLLYVLIQREMPPANKFFNFAEFDRDTLLEKLIGDYHE